jgi:arylsulfatase
MFFLSLIILVGYIGTAFAQQFDAPYYDLEKKNKDAWIAEDKQVDEKLRTLEKKFGKKPNIIYVLADDVGWGELGWQGGGKHRGTPTPQLDTMAEEGMRFWSAYAEPSCTPSRIAINTGRHPVRTGQLSVLWPGQTDGLSGKEVTVAEVLSKAGYSTAMHTMVCGMVHPTTGPARMTCIRMHQVPTSQCSMIFPGKRNI